VTAETINRKSIAKPPKRIFVKFEPTRCFSKRTRAFPNVMIAEAMNSDGRRALAPIIVKDERLSR